MMKNAVGISSEILKKDLVDYKAVRANAITRHALSNNDISSIAKSHDRIEETDFSFSLEVKSMEATNQKKSGRCWIFAATNVLREIIAKKCNMASFELSQSYIAFYDKLEKINFELEAIIDLIDCEYDDRTLSSILGNTIGDGGQWDMFADIVRKYGLVPKNVMPETFQSSNTQTLNKLINVELRKFAQEAKKIYLAKGIDEVRKYKEVLLQKFVNLMYSSYGFPPEKFDFEYVDSEGKYHLEAGFTPLSFFEKYIGQELDDYVSIINAPTPSKPFMKSYTIDYLGNVVGGKNITHLNLPMARMKELILAQLKDNRIVWFGSDVSYYGDRDSGVWDDKAFDYSTIFDLSFDAEKGTALDYGISSMNHAMCITGVNLKDGIPTKWKIENSWGGDSAKKGYYIMSDTWFDKYTYQAVIDKKYLTKDELDAYMAEPVHLHPWDPIGSLAD